MDKTRKFPDLIDVDIDEAVKNLQKAINYGDYLAEQKKKLSTEIVDLKADLRRQKLIALKSKDVCSGSDAKTREAQAEDYAVAELSSFEKAEIESAYLSDLFKNNHDRVEALRSIISSKKINQDNYNRNGV